MRGLLISILLLIVAPVSPAGAENACQQIYSTAAHWSESILSDPRWNMTPAERIQHDPEKYLYSRSFPGKIKDQCKIGACWIFATMEGYEYRAKLAGEPIRLSRTYVMARHLEDQAKILLSKRNLDDNFVLEEGGSTAFFQILVRKYGVVPESVWIPGQLDLSNGAAVDRFMIDLSLLINRLREVPPAQRKQYFKVYQAFIRKNLGHAPQTFSFRKYHDLTPIDFSHFPVFNPLRDAYKREVNIKRDPVLAWKAIADQLEATREPVPIAVDIIPSFIDDNTGIMSIEAFNTMGASVDDQIKFTQSRNAKRIGGHLMAVVDIDFNEDGTPRKLLIMNSWGETHGQRGYYHLYWDYYLKFGRNITVDAPIRKAMKGAKLFHARGDATYAGGN